MAVIESKLRVTLDDQVSAEARRVAGAVKEMEAAAEAQSRAMADARGRMLDAVAVGWAAYEAFSAPTEAAVDFERQLENIRQKADLTREAVVALGTEARQLGLDTAQGATRITNAIDVLLGTGIFDEQQALSVAGPLGRVATAYEADTTDVARATASLVGNMKIGVNEVERAYDMMAQAGQEGNFELKDMAREFPAITAGAVAIGVAGTEGLADLLAALEVAEKGAGSPAEAATNLANYMNKIMAPDAIKKFGAAGVDIVKEMRAASEAGLSPLERSLEILGELTDGGKQELLGQFFADSEVQKFIRPMLTYMEEYRRIRQSALDAEGVVQADFESRLQTPGGAISRFQASIENFNLTVGEALLPKLTEFINAVTPMVDGVARFVDANDQLVAAILEMVAAIVALRVAAAALGFAGAFFGLGGKKPSLGFGGLGGGSNGRPGAGGTGPAVGGAKTGPNFGGWGLLGFNALGIGSDMASFSDAVKQDGGAAWFAERNARDKQINDWLLGLDVGGVKPFAAMDAFSNAFHRPDSEGGIGGGYTGATQGQIDALKQQIAQLDAEIAEWPEEGMEARRAGLAEKLTAMEAELAASSNTVAAEFGSMLARMRAAAAAGVTIPIRTSGPALPQAVDRSLPGFSNGGWVSGPGSGTSDSILAWLSDGEYVVTADAARQYSGLLDGINSGNVGSLAAGSSAAMGARSGIGDVSIHLGGVSITGVSDPEQVLQQLEDRLTAKLRDALGGIYADIEYAG
jgi:TP901 family phage tail tape measure protein